MLLSSTGRQVGLFVAGPVLTAVRHRLYIHYNYVMW